MMKNTNFITVPTWNKGIWDITEFKTREEFRDFLIPLFKVPGEYAFDETSYLFNEQAIFYNENGYYTPAPEGTRDYKTYWDQHKNRCRNGALFITDRTMWYLPREYYMWLNFLPINNKETKRFSFPDVRDAQYHIALYELLAELHFRHASILKKRQIASSYYHCAKMINLLWFEQTPIIKMGASLKDYINDKGSWKFIEEYKDFLNAHTAWYRPMNPEKILHWQQQIEVTDSITKRPKLKGLKGVLQGMSFEQSETTGVGGPCTFFFYEEAGIAPTMDITVEFLFPAMQDGAITTGLFVAAGSVGKLDQCDPLKSMTLFPERNDIYPVTSNLLDDKGTIGQTGLFIPEQWSMRPFIDQYGNSLVEESVEAIDLMREQWKKDLSPEKYQFRISQHPKNIAEAFDARELSLFPVHLIKAQIKRIEDKTYYQEFLDITRSAEGLPEVKVSYKRPISQFPIDEKLDNKEGVLVVWERPVKNPEWGLYYASIDPVSEGKTVSSESLCSIYVYKIQTEKTVDDGDKSTTTIERDRIVAAWCGRFDDIKETHQRLELIIEWYNAWTIVENNISQFIIYMIERRKQKYLVTKDQIFFLKDLKSNTNVYQEYGWKNTGTIFRSHLLSYLIDYLKEELDHETKPDGTIVRTTYGIERIPDIMAMKEMSVYTEKLNVDRLVALSALIAFAKVQAANRGVRRVREESGKINLEKSKNLYKLDKGFFKHIGNNNSVTVMKAPKQPFRNIR